MLEHLPYPHLTLEQIYKVAGPDTVIYFELPYENVQRLNDDGVVALTQKRHWHEHVNFFSRASLAILLEREGFRVEDQTLVNVAQLPQESYNFFIAGRKVPA